jgi:hypothetical protein
MVACRISGGSAEDRQFGLLGGACAREALQRPLPHDALWIVARINVEQQILLFPQGRIFAGERAVLTSLAGRGVSQPILKSKLFSPL